MKHVACRNDSWEVGTPTVHDGDNFHVVCVEGADHGARLGLFNIGSNRSVFSNAGEKREEVADMMVYDVVFQLMNIAGYDWIVEVTLSYPERNLSLGERRSVYVRIDCEGTCDDEQ